eukprot:CAMPEP_0168628372 /NCGR_PEP_ID=MMETSP0449_2-20121227/11809_1 /TAXON_ID=1082188 /ORGANISM="Strombidium rassoulzadegani, Strain ras09" /LENGTH=277 /DNA_ID=CAMNT_0008670787 /DNA_START=42 /DNA_END=875 /DNA_ORIENTATION=+
MAATMSLSQTQARAFAGQAVRPARASASRAASRMVVRAEGESKAPATVDRSKDQLYFASEQSLSYLDGSLPGDFGFDPLGLSDPEGAGVFVSPEWLAYSEVIHGRFAMLGIAGCMAPEILGAAGVIPADTGLVWFKSGVILPAGAPKDLYWTDPFNLFWVELIAMQFAELRRWQDFRKPGSMGKQYFLGLEAVLGGSGEPAYPGGAFFNMFNLGKTPEAMKTLRLKEVKNGRLAMLAMFGIGAQAVITKVGPYQNLLDHLADPTHNNILTNFGNTGL